MGRSVRMGIDVGGTHTKAVAIDNATHEIIGKSSVKTTHDDPRGVAAGVVKSFENCLNENGISPDDVVFVHAPGDSHNGAPCVLIPVGRPQAGESRNYVTAVGIFYLFGHILGILR